MLDTFFFGCVHGLYNITRLCRRKINGGGDFFTRNACVLYYNQWNIFAMGGLFQRGGLGARFLASTGLGANFFNGMFSYLRHMFGQIYFNEILLHLCRGVALMTTIHGGIRCQTRICHTITKGHRHSRPRTFGRTRIFPLGLVCCLKTGVLWICILCSIYMFFRGTSMVLTTMYGVAQVVWGTRGLKINVFRGAICFNNNLGGYTRVVVVYGNCTRVLYSLTRAICTITGTDPFIIIRCMFIFRGELVNTLCEMTLLQGTSGLYTRLL